MTPGLLALAESMSLAQAAQTDRSEGPPLEPPVEEYDPGSPTTRRCSRSTIGVDKYVLKPIAQGYNFIMPDELQKMVDRGFSNIYWVPRFVNSLLQGKWSGAGRELARFLINSTVGIGGLWDMAKQEWGIEPSREDFGQTLGVWGFGPGPFLILPFMASHDGARRHRPRRGRGHGSALLLHPLHLGSPLDADRQHDQRAIAQPRAVRGRRGNHRRSLYLGPQRLPAAPVADRSGSSPGLEETEQAGAVQPAEPASLARP